MYFTADMLRKRREKVFVTFVVAINILFRWFCSCYLLHH